MYRNLKRHHLVSGLLILCLVFGSLLVVNNKYHLHGQKLLQQFGLSLRPVVNHPYKAVCNNYKAGYGHCLAEIALNIDGHPLNGFPATSGGYGPDQFHTAYNLPCTPGGNVATVCQTPQNFGPQTIAIVDAGNFSSGISGLNTSLNNYDQYFGIAQCNTTDGCLEVVNQTGSNNPANLPADAGWSDEIALDLETAHMICQTCKILLVEANTASVADLSAANLTASSFNPVAISNSWGASSDYPSYDANFQYNNIADLAATGDSGTVSVGAAWPADIPQVVAVAGTTLNLNSNNTYNSESVWIDSGGGCSNYYSAPSWQTSLSDWSTNGCGQYRSFGDISADANPNTGEAVNVDGTWYLIGGTSLATPIIAGIYGLSSGIASASSPPVQNLYLNNSAINFHNITTGNDCTSAGQLHCTATIGFNTPSGLGSPNGIGGFQTLPLNPTNLVANDINQNLIDLTWSMQSTTGISGYYVYQNGVKVANVTTESYAATGLTLNDYYNYFVVAYNNKGELSSPSMTVTARATYPADINQNGHVGLLDLSLLSAKYGQSGANLGRADINRDGVVNLLDLSILAQEYGDN